jgi:polar amino acid transport system substrate-binding protein
MEQEERMRRRRGWVETGLGIALAAVACLAVAMPAAAQGALAKAKAAKTLVVGISGGNAPIAWMSASDQPMGITLDFCQAMLKQEGIEKIDVYTMPFGSLIPALTSGRIDLACDTFFPTEKRKQLVDFTDILFYNSETLIVRKGNPKGIHKLADLGGKSAGSYEGTVWIDWLNDLNKQGAKIATKAYPTPTELIADVAAGRLDGGIVDALLAAYAVKQNPNLGIELVADYQPREKVANAVALAVRKDSADLREALNRTLAAMKVDGSLDRVFEKYGLVPASFYLKP